VSPRLRLLGALAAALALVGAASPVAHAGTYDISVRTDADIDGWQFFHDPGFSGCSIKSHPGPCADGDVPSPTTLRIFAYGTAEHLANAYWEWLAPQTTTIEHGSIRVVAATSANDTYAYMKARLRSESFVGSPQVTAAPRPEPRQERSTVCRDREIQLGPDRRPQDLARPIGVAERREEPSERSLGSVAFEPSQHRRADRRLPPSHRDRMAQGDDTHLAPRVQVALAGTCAGRR